MPWVVACGRPPGVGAVLGPYACPLVLRCAWWARGNTKTVLWCGGRTYRSMDLGSWARQRFLDWGAWVSVVGLGCRSAHRRIKPW